MLLRLLIVAVAVVLEAILLTVIILVLPWLLMILTQPAALVTRDARKKSA